MDRIGLYLLTRPYWLMVLLTLALLALPAAIWMDLKSLSDEALRKQANTLDQVISEVRGYYAKNVVGRVISSTEETHALHNYLEVDGAIPIPATLSLELGAAIGGASDITYRFISEFPFWNRAPHHLSAFEREALMWFRTDATRPPLTESSGNLWDRRLTLATPVLMSKACVDCHNTHPESPKTDWNVGDVRAIQTVTVHQPVTLSIWSMKWLLSYLALAGTLGVLVSVLQYRLAGRFSLLNTELGEANQFLEDVSTKLSRYLSPQVYRLIFSGKSDASLKTERKKLTVFFSDIKDFTATTERMQPEEITQLLNEYFTEMSQIAETHGATIDKFIGDSIVAFFGDPETRGAAEDARACVMMALDMQTRMADLGKAWRDRGIEHPFRIRIGINTGYCNVGNFGSDSRMDYTIIGPEANLASRLESVAEPGGIVLSYETYAHVRDIVEAKRADPVTFKGISREVIPYHVRSLSEKTVIAAFRKVKDEDKLTLDLDELDDEARGVVRDAIRAALKNR